MNLEVVGHAEYNGATHLARKTGPRAWKTLCGLPRSRMRSERRQDEGAVSCKRCLKHLEPKGES